MGFNLFGSSNSSDTKNEYNYDYSQEGNQGVIANGSDNKITTTDHGSVAGGISVANNALLASANAVNKSLEFGSSSLNKSLDFGSHALDKSSETFNASLNSVVSFADKILRNGATATKNAMSLAKYSTTDNTQKNTDLMIKVASGLAFLTVVFMIYSASKKR